MQKYALLGNPVSHSLSPHIYDFFFHRYSLKYEYDLIATSVDSLAATVAALCANNFNGFNVTAPLKIAITSYIQSESVVVKNCGSCNVIKIANNSHLHAENTDGIGFEKDFLVNVPVSLKGNSVLILGAGGVVPVLVTVLRRHGFRVKVAFRTKCSNQYLHGVAMQTIPSIEKDSYNILINATGVGLAALNDMTNFDLLSGVGFYYDLSYGSIASGSIEQALSCGVVAVDGLGMLVWQAASAFKIWTGITAKSSFIGEIIQSLYAKYYT